MFALYVVATPIGNLEDISLRGLRVLRSVKLIAAEDTRKTKRLLDNYDIRTPLTSYHEHNKFSKLEYLTHFLAGTGDVALVSDAGTPGVSDPGHELVVAADKVGIPIIPIPGASVVITALSVSALPTDRFTYVGFLPRTAGERRRMLDTLRDDRGTLVMFEAPHRLRATLRDVLSVLGDRKIAVCREMTKIHEEVFRGRMADAAGHFTEPKGEFTLVIEGQQATEKPELTADIEHRLGKMRERGVSAKEAIPQLSKETGLARRELYRAWVDMGR